MLFCNNLRLFNCDVHVQFNLVCVAKRTHMIIELRIKCWYSQRVQNNVGLVIVIRYAHLNVSGAVASSVY